jgi:hypothetical protein
VIFKKAKERVYRVIPLPGSSGANSSAVNATSATGKPIKAVANGMGSVQCAIRNDYLTVLCVGY